MKHYAFTSMGYNDKYPRVGILILGIGKRVILITMFDHDSSKLERVTRTAFNWDILMITVKSLI